MELAASHFLCVGWEHIHEKGMAMAFLGFVITKLAGTTYIGLLASILEIVNGYSCISDCSQLHL